MSWVRVIDLGGRYFQPAEVTTARQDGWVMVQVAEAGLDKFAGKTLDESIAHEVVMQSFRSGRMFHLLAGMLVECDVKWTPAIAEQNAEYFAEITDPASKAAMQDAFVGVLLGFFLSAPTSSAPSPSVSTEAAPARRPRRKRARLSTEAAMAVTGAA